MTNKRFRIVHHISEGEDSRPVVTHLFYGDTVEEAEHVYDAHRKSDAFLRQCDDCGIFDNRVGCHSVLHLERVGVPLSELLSPVELARRTYESFDTVPSWDNLAESNRRYYITQAEHVLAVLRNAH